MNNRQIVIKSTYPEIRVADENLRSILLETKISDELVSGCELALHELLINLVDHAYRGDPNGSIIIDLSINEDVLNIQTFDSGVPAILDFDAITMPDPTGLAVGGYGMAIIQLLVDKMDYQRTGDQNKWTLMKKLS